MSPSPPAPGATPLLLLLLLLLTLLPPASPAHVSAACNEDPCLRSLHRTSAASPFCSSYLTAATTTITVTVTPTTFSIYGSGVVESHTVDAPSSVPPKASTATTTPPPATPAFTAACTGGATQLSSACSCLVSGTQSAGVTVSGETITLTTTAPPQTSTACAPPYYNVQYTGGTFSWPELPGPSGQQWTNPLYPAVTTNQSCCYLCFVIPGCASFLIDTINGGCRLDQLSDSTAATPQDPMCPWGVVADYAPVLEYGYGYGLGPCGFYVESNGDPAD